MRAADAKCPTCGGPPVDVAPDFDTMAPGLIPIRDAWIGLRCANGHRFCLHTQDHKFEVLAEGQRGHDLETGAALK